MGKVDCHTSDYFNNNERFADMCNVVLFQGRQVIKAAELEEADADVIHISDRVAKKVLADKVRKWHGHYICMFVLENQHYVDYRMVLRNMLTEILSYDKQYKKKRAEHQKKKDLTGDEKLSGISKNEKFIPVVAIVVYFGSKKWDGARTLYGLLDIDEDSGIENFITNYKLNLYDYHDYENFDAFQTELKNVFETLKYAGRKSELKKRLDEDFTYQQLEEDTVELIEVLTNVKIQRIKEVEEQSMGNMCQAFEDYRQEGVEEGIRLQMKETNKAKRAAERAKEKNIELKKEMRQLKALLKKAGVAYNNKTE